MLKRFFLACALIFAPHSVHAITAVDPVLLETGTATVSANAAVGPVIAGLELLSINGNASLNETGFRSVSKGGEAIAEITLSNTSAFEVALGMRADYSVDGTASASTSASSLSQSSIELQARDLNGARIFPFSPVIRDYTVLSSGFDAGRSGPGSRSFGFNLGAGEAIVLVLAGYSRLFGDLGFDPFFLQPPGTVDMAGEFAASLTVQSVTYIGAPVTPVPLPASLTLLLIGIGGLAVLRRRKSVQP